MQYVWMILSLIIGVGVAYLIWDEFIVKKERPQESTAERYAEADIKAFMEETQPRDQVSDATAAAALHSAVENAEAKLHELEAAPAETPVQAEASMPEVEVAEVEVPEAEVAERTAVVDVNIPSDDLTKIRGVGKVYQQRLNEAGIFTYAQLAETHPAKLAEIAKAIDAANVEDWPHQARELMG